MLHDNQASTETIRKSRLNPVYLYRWTIQQLVSAVRYLYRQLSLLFMLAAMGIDGLMHMFNIPHMEGWWVPLIGSSAALGIARNWMPSLRKSNRPSKTPDAVNKQ